MAEAGDSRRLGLTIATSCGSMSRSSRCKDANRIEGLPKRQELLNERTRISHQWRLRAVKPRIRLS